MSDLKNEGQRLLRLAYPDRGDAAQLAREIGTPPSVVSRWLNGDQRPVTASRIFLWKRSGIPIESWDEPPKDDSDSPPTPLPQSSDSPSPDSPEAA